MSTTNAPSATPATSVANPSMRVIDSKAAIAIINKRSTLKVSDAGQLMQFIVQGNGQFLPKGHKYTANGTDRENQFDRTIYNLRANSAIAMAANKSLFTDALKAESAAETSKAHDLFNEYLNKIQISFSVIEPSTRKFTNGSVVRAIVETAINAANEQAIVVNDVSEVRATTAAKTTFSVEDLMEA